jgi:hypothetical protein
MIRRDLIPAIAALALLMCGALLNAQALPTPLQAPQGPTPLQVQAPAGQAQAPSVILKLQVTISRFVGTNRISSQPYVLSLVPDVAGSLRVGAEVAVPSTAMTPSSNATPSYTMQQIGTQVDCVAKLQPDGRYRLSMTVTDRSVIASAQASEVGTRVANVPAFRNLTTASSIVLGDGQSTQFSSAPDRASNEVFKVDVLLTYEK